MKIKRLGILAGCVIPAAVLARPAESPSRDVPESLIAAKRLNAKATPRVVKQVKACEDPNSSKSADKGKKQPWKFEVSEDEKQAARLFYQEHSPKRWEAYQSLPEEERRGVWGKMIGRYKMIQFFASDEQVHSAKVRQVELEDEIYALKRDLQRTPAGQDEQVKAKLREKLDEHLTRQMEERAAHISRLEKALQGEKERFVEDVQNRDAILEEMYRQELERKPAIGPETPKIPERGQGEEKKQ